MTGAQLRGVLLALAQASGSDLVLPDLPIDGAQLHAALVALSAAIGGEVAIPDLPLTTEQIRAALVGLAAEAGVVSTDPPFGGKLIIGGERPSPSAGRDGDYFLLVENGLAYFYGPKSGGSWGAETAPMTSGEVGVLFPFLAAALPSPGSVA